MSKTCELVSRVVENEDSNDCEQELSERELDILARRLVVHISKRSAYSELGAPLNPASLVGRGIHEGAVENEAGAEPIQDLVDKLARAGEWGRLAGGSPCKAGPVKLGAGLAAIPSVIAKKIQQGDYVDFAEFPPARPDDDPVAPGQSGGKVLIVQAADLRRSRRKIPDVMVWTRCFTLYMGVLIKDKPERIINLLGYMDGIIRSARKFNWQACEEYDRRFRQIVAGDEGRSWSIMDPGLYAECFTSQARSVPATRDLNKGGLWGATLRSRKRQRDSHNLLITEQERAEAGTPGCVKYNRYNGDCKFGVRCRYQHVCSSCGGQHPVTKCDGGSKEK